VLAEPNLANMIDTNDSCRLTAVLPDDLAKTDNVKSMTKSVLRSTFYRSVSFMKKSFNRSNSSLSVGSVHSCDSCMDESVTSNPNMNDTQRSCLKGSRIKAGRKESSKGLRVRFKRSHDKIIKIEPFFEFAEDLWYTKTDERLLFSQPGLETASDAANAEMYMKAYTQARKQVYPKTWFEGKDPTPAKPEKLSTSFYDDIVEGRVHGFAGLEQYSVNLKKTRRVHIQQTVLMIAAAYFDSAASLEGSWEDKEKLVRSYAKSLSAVDRYWSAAMGQADADAAADVYGEYDDGEDDSATFAVVQAKQ
jgi:hypothetical protein